MNNLSNSKSERIVKITFVIYFFFIIFGTALPFRPRIEDVADKSTSNIVNQILSSATFLVSVYCLLFRWKSFLRLIRKEKFLFLFFLWVLLSITWSDYSLSSFKRAFQIFTSFLICAAMLVYVKTPDDMLKYFKWLLSLMIICSLISVLFIPGAIDARNNAWLGLAEGKNNFGQLGLASSILWFNALSTTAPFGIRVWNVTMLMLSLVALIGSQSMTAMVTTLTMLFIAIVFFVNKRLKAVGVGNFFILLSTATFLGIGLSIFFLAPNLFESLPQVVGKDSTFTGRTDLWLYMLGEIGKHPLAGCGYGGFWVIESPDLMALYQQFVWLPNQAHNGYIDILNETGIIGLSLFLLSVYAYFMTLMRHKSRSVWKWFVFSVLLINLQEATLFRMNSFSGTLFICSYLSLYAESLGKDSNVYN